jgi:ParB family chromosome partitioning protein
MADSKSKNRSRLGRGLSSLISVSEPAEAPSLPASVEQTPPPEAEPAEAKPVASGAVEVPLNAIVPNPHQPRKVFNEASLAELAASIRSTGLIQPIVVRPTTEGYELIAGERRWRAAQLAGLQSLPALLREVDALTQAQMALVENIQREDLNPIDRAAGYSTLLDQLGLTQAELATRLGEDRSSIANFLRLLELTPPVRDLVRDGRLSVGHGKLLASVADAAEQQRLAELAVAQELSVRNLERLLQQGGTTPPAARPPEGSAHIQDLEKNLSRQLGMRVQLRSAGKGKGRLTIHYASLDQFDDLLGKLGVSPE